MLSSTQSRREPQRHDPQNTGAEAWSRVAQARPVMAARLNCEGHTAPSSATSADALHLSQASGPFLVAPSIAENGQGVCVGLILLSDQFDTLVASTPAWQKAFNQPRYEKAAITDGDQVFSSQSSQNMMFTIAGDWIQQRFIADMATGIPDPATMEGASQ